MKIEALHTLPRTDAIRVAPTSSIRTVMTMKSRGDCPIHFIKLHYPHRISRFNRSLRPKNIRTSVHVSSELERIEFERFAFLPESLGFTFGKEGNSWGFLVREIMPRPHRENRFMIPFFSLYGGDLHDSGHIPLLVQIIERLKVNPFSFLLREIMIPVLECWCRVVRETGFMLESHAQNLLLEVDREFRPLRIVHRDLDVWIDSVTRHERGLDSSRFDSILGADSPYPREAYYSLIYDHFIGNELFDYLVKTVGHHYSIDDVLLRREVAKAFHLNFADADRFFPKSTTYYFSNEILPKNNFALIDTKKPPEWR